MTEHDAVVVGSGPNGLTAAVELAAAGRAVHVIEGTDRLGGACSSADDVLTGALVDLGSAVHPFGAASPAFAAHRLDEHGLRWLPPDVLVAHPLDDAPAGRLHHDRARLRAEMAEAKAARLKSTMRFVEFLLVSAIIVSVLAVPLVNLKTYGAF